MNFLRSLFGAGPAANEVDIATTRAALDDPTVQIVDCREQREWKSGHIDGSKLIPLRSIGQRMDELDQHRPVIVLCRSGHRSAIAARQLTKAGFVDARSMRGGINAWSRAGYELVSR